MSKVNTCTDAFHFENQSFFEQLRKFIPNDVSFSQNLIECKDDMLFGWNPVDCTVLAFNWRLAQSKPDACINCQQLVPATAIDFTVNKLTASPEGQYLAVSGNRGVAILEIPCRYGPNGQYKDGKSKVLCSTHILDDHYFCSNQFVNIQQVRWHPASSKDCNLMVLLSNNSIRVYEESRLQCVWKIGPTPCAMPPTKSSLPYLNSLGDTAVDFDIAAPRTKTITNETDENDDISQTNAAKAKFIEWPLIILWGNGNIFIALIGLDTIKPRLQGPLSMYPTTKDNYGLDSCSIITFQSNPTAIVVAEPSGKLYHMILVDNEPAEDASVCDILDDFEETGIRFEPNEWIINVVEVVELELGLTERAKNDVDYCPIQLKADINNDSRYFAYHNAGLHAISMEFMPELQRFFDGNDDSSLDLVLSKRAHAEYLVCTKALEGVKSNVVVGFALLQSPSGLVLLLSSGQVVSLNVITNPRYLRLASAALANDKSKNDTITSSSATIDSEVFSNAFEESVRQALAAGVSQPILKLNNGKEATPKESIELLLDAFQLLRDQYITKHDKVRQMIEKRVKIQRVLEEQQRQEVADLMLEKLKLRENAESLAERYEELNDRQQDILKKLHEVLRAVNSRCPNASAAERNFAEKINKIDAATKELANKIAVTKKKMGKQQLYQTSTASPQRKTFALQPKQEAALKEVIAENTSELNTQVKEIQQLKKFLNIE